MSTQTYSWNQDITSDAAVIDLFAGAGGWEAGAEMLTRGLSKEFCGVELDKAAVQTRDLNGFSTLHDDVRNCDVHQFPYARGLVASPPCPTFSIAGKGEGRKLIPALVSAIKGAPTPEHADPDFVLEARGVFP